MNYKHIGGRPKSIQVIFVEKIDNRPLGPLENQSKVENKETNHCVLAMRNSATTSDSPLSAGSRGNGFVRSPLGFLPPL